MTNGCGTFSHWPYCSQNILSPFLFVKAMSSWNCSWKWMPFSFLMSSPGDKYRCYNIRHWLFLLDLSESATLKLLENRSSGIMKATLVQENPNLMCKGLKTVVVGCLSFFNLGLCTWCGLAGCNHPSWWYTDTIGHLAGRKSGCWRYAAFPCLYHMQATINLAS
jgi:hypothetical protein